MPARTNKATTTTGTTTAMAVLPPVPRPPPSFDFSGFCREAGAVVVEDDDAECAALVACDTWDGVMTEVTTTTEALCPETEGDTVTSEVTICVEAGWEDTVTTEVAASDEEAAALDDGGSEDEEAGGVEEERSTGDELAGADDEGMPDEEDTVRDADDGRLEEAEDERAADEDSLGVVLDDATRTDVLATVLLVADIATAMGRTQAEKKTNWRR